MPSRPGPAATRRAALGGTLAAVVGVAACDLAPPGPTPQPDPPDQTDADPDVDTDTGILEAARAELDELLTLLAAAAAARPGRTDALADPLADLVALHQAHRDALQGDMATLAPPSLPDTATRVRAVIDQRQRRLQRRLTGWALDARSGTLARLLASMSAAIAQHAVASSPAGGPPGRSS